ncbi:hypothetical protein NW768_002181 [Fusarium equiseti]|uniref:Amidoligase enzyme n=1 Tax=Fusarium equiseti TaxID=61235 RepID=A0ABQ8RN22_FUSEQ|nr:hypothetical protein NW768_002181 [Fusarium equiseti]
MSPKWRNITFGAELEFMTPVPHQYLSSVASPAAASRYHIAKIFAEQTSFPTAVECSHDNYETCTVCFELPKNKVIQGTGYINPGLKTDCFLFKQEHLFTRSRINQDRLWPGVEMCTPVFKEGELDNGLQIMKTGFKTLRNSGIDISADQSCGLHVHVGVTYGMDLRFAKKVSTLVVLLENSLILPLVAQYRAAGTYAQPVFKESAAAYLDGITSAASKAFEKHVPEESTFHPGTWNRDDPKSFFKMLQIIWSTADLKTLSRSLPIRKITRCGMAICLRKHNGDRPSYLDNDFEGTPSTFEFRYSQMTFDHVTLRNWVEVVTRIVSLAQAEEGEYKSLVEMIVGVNHEAGDDAWKVLLVRFGLDERIPEWESQRAMFARRVTIAHLDDELLLKADV